MACSVRYGLYEGEGGEDEEEEGRYTIRTEKEHNISTPGISDLTSVRMFKTRCARVLNKFPYGAQSASGSINFTNSIARKMGTTRSRVKELKNLCNPADLLQPQVGSPTASHSSLHCLQNPKLVISYLEKNQIFSVPLPNLLRRDVVVKDSSTESLDRVSDGAVVLWIDIFHPTKKVRDHSFLVLASQTMTELRDLIICPNDYLCTEELSETPDAFQEVTGKPHKVVGTPHSAFFFINNTFYDDRREPCDIDVSRQIIDWTKETETRITMSPSLDHFKLVDMDIQFDQLELRLGYPYLYSHGNCEHVLMFRDLRLFNPKTDTPFMADYPRLVFCTKLKTQACSACMSDAVWLTCNDELSPASPSFFCHDCFVKLHYSADEKKLCQFKAYRYQAPDYPVVSTIV